MPHSGSDLRERKKRETESAIERAAVGLALELGHASVTVAAICERADVSRSTFFNYMPSREAAIFGRAVHHIEPAVAMAVLDASSDVAPTLAVFRVIGASLGAVEVNAELSAARNRLIAEQPDALPAIMSPFMALTADLTGVLAGWLALDEDRRRLPEIPVLREASLTVSVAVSAFISLVTDLAGSGGDVEASEQLFADAVARIGALTER